MNQKKRIPEILYANFFTWNKNSLQCLSRSARGASVVPIAIPQCRLSEGERLLACRRLNSLRLRNRSRMFNSTSRYLVYCTINRSIKEVTIIPRCRNEIHEVNATAWSLPDFHYDRIVPLRRNEPRFSAEFRALNRGPQCAGVTSAAALTHTGTPGDNNYKSIVSRTAVFIGLFNANMVSAIINCKRSSVVWNKIAHIIRTELRVS